MPYITKKQRKALERPEGPVPLNPGELNYLLTTLCHTYIERYGLRYNTLNDVIGALECAKLECYRRVAGPYEDQKCAENGDVYPEI